MDPLTLLGLGALLLFSGSKAGPKPPRLPTPMPKLVVPGNTAVIRTPPQGVVEMGEPYLIKSPPPRTAAPSTIDTPLSLAPSQGGGPPLAPPLSADITTDEAPRAASTSESKTSRSQVPGFNSDAARRGAAAMANHLRRSGRANYDRRMLKQWQTHAGLPSDGLYGPATRGALAFFGVKDPPPAFIGSGMTAYAL